MVVGQHLVVEPEALDPGTASGRCEPDDPQRPLAEQVREAVRSLARRARQHHGFGAAEARLAQHQIEQDRGGEERAQDERCIVALALLGEVLVVDRRKARAVRCRIDEASRVRVRTNGEVRRHRDETEHALPLGQRRRPGGEHAGVGPGGNAAPPIRRGEQPPIAHPVAHDCVGDVVGAQREALDEQLRLALGEVIARRLALDQLARGEIVTANPELGHQS